MGGDAFVVWCCRDPVEHSLSPVIHEEFFRLTGLEGEYKKFYIQKGMLKEGIYNLLKQALPVLI